MKGANKSASGWFFVIVRISVVAAIFYFIFRKVPLASLRPLIVPSLLVAFVIAVILNVAQASLCALRWYLLAANTAKVPGFSKSFAAYMEGLFFNQALPSFIGGDAVRVMRWHAFGVRTSEALLSVLRDRLFGAIGAASFATMACVLLWNQPIERYKVFSLLVLSSVVLLASLMALTLSQWPRFSSFFVSIRSIHALAIRLAAKPLEWRTIWISLLVSLAALLLQGISVFVLATALGEDISFLLAVSAAAAIVLISMIPISVAGWGVREVGFLALLVPLGASSEKVLMLGICFGLAGVCSALLGGVSIALRLSSP